MRTRELILSALLAAALPAAGAEPVFTDVTESAGIAGLGITLTESVAWGDYDNDGDLDLVITGDGGETRLWRNDTPREHRWLGVRLRGAAPNTSAIGARVELRTAAGATVQEVSGGAGRGSQNEHGLVFGLGDAGVVESLTVRWPDGSEQVVLLTTSFTNRCSYCMAAHCAIAAMQGVEPETVAALRDGRALSAPRLEALRSFTAQVVEARGWVDDEALAGFLAAGYSRSQSLEVVLGVAMKTLSNYANHLAETPLDDVFRGQAWSHPEDRTSGAGGA